MYTPTVQNGIGIGPGKYDARVFARGQAFALGDVVQFDLAQSDDATTNSIVGDPASGFANVILPTANGAAGRSVLAVCLEAIALGQKGRVRVRGQCPVMCAGAVTVGDDLCAASGAEELSTSAGAGDRYIARAVETVAGSSRRLVLCDFDGVYGFGSQVS
jgi:hypothetical protein